MKIQDLSKIDIKEIDVAKIKDMILQHKENTIQVLLVVISFFIAVSVFNKSQSEIKTYKNKIATLQAKTGAIDEYNKTQGEVTEFLSKVPESVSEDQMISLVTDLAGTNRVKILTFSQAKVEKKNTVASTALSFTLSADSFVDMIRFLKDIEKGKEFLQVWALSIDPAIEDRKSKKDKLTVPINFKVDIASIKVEQ